MAAPLVCAAFLLRALLAAATAADAARIAPATAAVGDARALFVLHCASCHGETGDGRGTATLDRPARSFQDGGFSYGNTPEALLRTITYGIPGTPMPAAPSALTEAERAALADYVLSLGPPLVTATVAESTLAVHDKPVVARGKLPPIAEGLPARPRGLVIGTLEGLSFEYRTDDVRLLAVRQGAFVDRRDWRGRGGDTLLPLGVPIHLARGGDPEATFTDRTGAPLAARLSETFVERARAGLRYRLIGPASSEPLAAVVETVSARSRPAGAGFARTFTFESLSGEAIKVRVRAADSGPTFFACGSTWNVRRRADKSFEAVAVRALHKGEVLSLVDGAAFVSIELAPGAARTLEIETLLLPTFAADIEERWRAGLAQ